MEKIKLSLDDFEETTGDYIEKDLFISIYNLNEIIDSEQDFSNIQKIQSTLASLIKNSNKANMHFIISGENVDKDTFSYNVLQYLDKRIALGELDSDESEKLFGQDISYKSMPNIKGRGFTKIKNEMVDVQIFKSNNNDFNTQLNNSLFKELSKHKTIESENNFQKHNKNLPIRKLNRQDILTISGKIDYNKILEEH